MMMCWHGEGPRRYLGDTVSGDDTVVAYHIIKRAAEERFEMLERGACYEDGRGWSLAA